MARYFGNKDLYDNWDAIVVGGGHAGCEAALASARLGVDTLLVTQSLGHLGCMPCNPSIGGLAKSHLVFELDALGGEMAKNTDATGIHFKVLNTSRGPAVRANRVQCDKVAYTMRMQAVVAMQNHLSCLEDECLEIIAEGANTDDSLACKGRITGIITRYIGAIQGKSVVITCGTALNGYEFIGKLKQQGGGGGRPGATQLSNSLRKYGFQLFRLKTGTPPRLHVGSIDFSRLDSQPGETNPVPYFSLQHKLYDICSTWNSMEVSRGCSTWNNIIPWLNRPNGVESKAQKEKMKCSTWNNLPLEDEEIPIDRNILYPWAAGKEQKMVSMTHTTEETAEIVKKNLSKSALYGGAIEGTGVRYCPSFEDKVVKFTTKTEHHVILEPESITSSSVYPNGLSNSLPKEVQGRLVHSVPGLEKAEFLAWGYAIEYDAIDARELDYTLQSKRIHGLYFAGQTNGTTGYEEAAGQGLVAGVNAALEILGKQPLNLTRENSYLGVMIDDLITKGTQEPYRMFTSRAERRLHLRQDNARIRLYSESRRIGLADDDYLFDTKKLISEVQGEISRLESSPPDAFGPGSWARRLMHPDASYRTMSFANSGLSDAAIEQVEIHYHYAGYFRQEQITVQRLSSEMELSIPDDIDYHAISALRYESREKLSRVRPMTLAQASRIPGVNPADLAVLSVWVHRLRHQR